MHVRRLASFGIAAILLATSLPAAARPNTDPDDVDRNTRIRQLDIPDWILERRANHDPVRGKYKAPSAEVTGRTAASRLTRQERALHRQRDARQAKTLRRRLDRSNELTGSGAMR
jgi:hypothetical protein